MANLPINMGDFPVRKLLVEQRVQWFKCHNQLDQLSDQATKAVRPSQGTPASFDQAFMHDAHIFLRTVYEDAHESSWG